MLVTAGATATCSPIALTACLDCRAARRCSRSLVGIYWKATGMDGLPTAGCIVLTQTGLFVLKFAVLHPPCVLPTARPLECFL